MRFLVPICVALALFSLVIVPGAPSYDPLMWLLWGRERRPRKRPPPKEFGRSADSPVWGTRPMEVRQ